MQDEYSIKFDNELLYMPCSDRLKNILIRTLKMIIWSLQIITLFKCVLHKFTIS